MKTKKSAYSHRLRAFADLEKLYPKKPAGKGMNMTGGKTTFDREELKRWSRPLCRVVGFLPHLQGKVVAT